MKVRMIGFIIAMVIAVLITGLAIAHEFEDSLEAYHNGKCGSVGELEDVDIILEVNETDEDAEIVLKMNSDDGIERLAVWDPHRKKVLKLKSRDRGRIGLSKVILETGEPDIKSILDTYCEGEYKVFVKTVSGKCLLGTTELLHDRLPAPSFTPSKGELVDPDVDLAVTWDPVPEAVSYTIEIEQDDLDVNITTKLDGDTTNFIVPAGFLTPGIEYEIGIATEAPNGNVSVAQGSFQTIE